MSLYHKYRPINFEEIIGNESVIKSLDVELMKKDPSHAYLLSGPSGCGKTTIGRIIAHRMDSHDTDYHEVDSADFRGIDTIREIRRNAHLAPMSGKSRIWLIDECHKLTNDAQNALLKILEDPPSHAYFILCTTDPQKLLATVKGRCSHYEVRQLDEKQLFKLLRGICRGESKRIAREVLDQIIQDSQGSPRNAIQILDQIIDLDREDQLEAAKKSAEIQSQTILLCRALTQRGNWKKISGILQGLRDEDMERTRLAVLGYCASILVKGTDMPLAGLIMENFEEPFYNSGFSGLVLACYRTCKES